MIIAILTAAVIVLAFIVIAGVAYAVCWHLEDARSRQQMLDAAEKLRNPPLFPGGTR